MANATTTTKALAAIAAIDRALWTRRMYGKALESNSTRAAMRVMCEAVHTAA